MLFTFPLPPHYRFETMGMSKRCQACVWLQGLGLRPQGKRKALPLRSQGAPVTDRDVHAYVAHYGRWQALAFRCWDWKLPRRYEPVSS
jgi:hypothetical protein